MIMVKLTSKVQKNMIKHNRKFVPYPLSKKLASFISGDPANKFESLNNFRLSKSVLQMQYNINYTRDMRRDLKCL